MRVHGNHSNKVVSMLVFDYMVHGEIEESHQRRAGLSDIFDFKEKVNVWKCPNKQINVEIK